MKRPKKLSREKARSNNVAGKDGGMILWSSIREVTGNEDVYRTRNL